MRLSNASAPLLLAAIGLQGLLAAGCQSDRSEFGAEFIQPREEHAMRTDTVNTLKISIQESHGGHVVNFSSFSLGEVHDDTFGKTQCAASGEFFISSSNQMKTFNAEAEADSLTLRLKIRGSYGKGRIKLSVYEATSETHGASDKKIGEVARGVLLAETTVDEKTTVVRLALPKDLATRIARALAADAYDIRKFREHFRGLYITAERENTSDYGTMFFLNAGDRNTGLTVFWHNDANEVQSASLPFFLGGERSNWIDYDFKGTSVEQALGKSSQEQEASGLAYLVGDGGTSMTVDFSQFYESWKAKGVIAVQRAQLLIAADASNPKGADTITYGLASFTGEGDSYTPIVDANQSAGSYGGWYDHKQGCYVLNITGYVQHLLNERNYPSSLHVLPASAYRGICRLIVGTCHNPQRPARLVVTYTEL